MKDSQFFGTKEPGRKELEAFRGLSLELAGKDDFGDVEQVCIFVGYPRSGHSLLGSLVDAHRHAVIAHELDLLYFLEQGFGRDQLYALLAENSRRFTSSGREWSGYRYEVPDAHQGRWESVRLIGDKKGGRTTHRLDADPSLLDRLCEVAGVPVKLLHVMRNPFDIIATRSRRNTRLDLDGAADAHLAMVAAVERIEDATAAADFLTVRHEDLSSTAAPERLREVCGFLGLDAPDDWVTRCASIVRTTPSRSRERVEWTGAARAKVEDAIGRHRHLAGYTFA